MALKRMVLEIGMGTDIRGADSTKAAVRALRDALWHNSLSVATALGKPLEAMLVEVTIGVPRPETVDKAAVLAVLPYGRGTVVVVEAVGVGVGVGVGPPGHVNSRLLIVNSSFCVPSIRAPIIRTLP